MSKWLLTQNLSEDSTPVESPALATKLSGSSSFDRALESMLIRNFNVPCSLCNGNGVRIIPEVENAELSLFMELTNYQRAATTFWENLARLRDVQQELAVVQAARVLWEESLVAERDLQLLDDKGLMAQHLSSIRNAAASVQEGLRAEEVERQRLVLLASGANLKALESLVRAGPANREIANKQYALSASEMELEGQKQGLMAPIMESLFRIGSIRTLLDEARARVEASAPPKFLEDDKDKGEHDTALEDKYFDLAAEYPIDDFVMAPSRREQLEGALDGYFAYMDESVDRDGERYVDDLFFHASDEPNFGEEK